MVKANRRQLGQWGESVAAHHLEGLGYKIVARNWRCARGEIDLLVQAGEILVFVEVKTRRGRALGTPEEGVTPAKGRKLLELAQIYLYQHDLAEIEWRIDVVAVELDPGGKLLRCDHIPNAILGW